MDNDVLSDVLRTVRLSGAIFYEVRAGSTWAAETPPAQWLAPRLMPQTPHLIAYHVVTRGDCWAALAGDAAPPVHLVTGSIVLFAHGDAHVMATDIGFRSRPLSRADGLPSPEESLPSYIDAHGDDDERARLLCGFLGCDVQPFNPLIQALPRLLHVGPDAVPANVSLAALTAAAVAESSMTRIGSVSVLARLSELLFIEAVRSYMESLPADQPGWLGALVDTCVGRTLRLLHGDPARAWTLQILAREAGFSRTVLVERFTRALGVAPMGYLLKWRMQIAASLLSDGGLGIARVSSAVGYGSEEAFSRAFKRCTGYSPAEWRHRAVQADDAGTRANTIRVD